MSFISYMQEYLERILEWLGGFRAPVILLSATLPERQRKRMAEAYLRDVIAAGGRTPPQWFRMGMPCGRFASDVGARVPGRRPSHRVR